MACEDYVLGVPMNRFLIEHHTDAIAKSLCDQHIVKMPLEEAQMLSQLYGMTQTETTLRTHELYKGQIHTTSIPVPNGLWRHVPTTCSHT